MTIPNLVGLNGETLDGEGPELILPPGQTPITSAKRIKRIRSLPATIGFVDDEIMKLARALLIQYGPISVAQKELMARQAAVEDYLMGEISRDQMAQRIIASTKHAAEPTPSDPE